MSESFQRGGHARRIHKRRCANPYIPDMIQLHEDWDRGWEREDKKQHEEALAGALPAEPAGLCRHQPDPKPDATGVSQPRYQVQGSVVLLRRRSAAAGDGHDQA